MAKKLSEASLRKKLKQMDEVSLIQMIIDLYRGSNAAEEAINLSFIWRGLWKGIIRSL
jgi:hypothetical protein